jgi:hypothetical protein
MVRRSIHISVIVAALVFAAAAFGAPVTKQNGKSSLTPFTSICTLPQYLVYGFCDGDATAFTNVKGKLDAVQSKPGRYDLNFTFTNLTPGGVYRLWGNNGSFFVVGTAVADLSGSAKYTYQTTSPAGLGFDLNVVRADWDVNGITIVTSYWSNQLLSVKSDSTLSAG